MDLEETYQEIVGFGASIAWYDNFVTGHPNKDEIYDVIFRELGIDILRLQNWYGKRDRVGEHTAEIVEEAEKSLGHPISIMITSWAPPAELKSNGDVKYGGTLIKENGEYAYDRFADYWYDSLLAYEDVGIVPEYISIQNEPDYKADWNSCLFAPTETDELAGYDRALEAVYNKFQQEMDNPPKLLGPETIGIGYQEFYDYLEAVNFEYIYGIAHHLYRGGEHNNPTSFRYSMNQLDEKYGDIPLFQTEFERGDNGYRTAWLIHNALVEENVEAYLYWDLIWDNGGLVGIENPWFTAQWRTEEGYYRSDEYYSMKHFSGFIDPGYTRVDIGGGSNKIKLSAFISPDNDEIVIVGVNTLILDKEIKIETPGFNIDKSNAYKSVFIEGGEKFVELGSLSEGNTVSIPAHSVVTIVLQGSTE
ncbi:MAG: hypothetical protein ACLFUI_07825 [Halanaerobiales bacterium]